jgi:hypothetical protein
MERDAAIEIEYARRKIAELVERPHPDKDYNDSLIAFWQSALDALLKAQKA